MTSRALTRHAPALHPCTLAVRSGRSSELKQRRRGAGTLAPRRPLWPPSMARVVCLPMVSSAARGCWSLSCQGVLAMERCSKVHSGALPHYPSAIYSYGCRRRVVYRIAHPPHSPSYCAQPCPCQRGAHTIADNHSRRDGVGAEVVGSDRLLLQLRLLPRHGQRPLSLRAGRRRRRPWHTSTRRFLGLGTSMLRLLRMLARSIRRGRENRAVQRPPSELPAAARAAWRSDVSERRALLLERGRLRRRHLGQSHLSLRFRLHLCSQRRRPARAAARPS